MGQFKDLTGNIYGKLTTIEQAENVHGKVAWKCRCECGKLAVVNAAHLLSAHTKSCGCISTNRIRGMRKTHGMSGTTEWNAYWAANRRCSPNNKEKRADYYDRGIRFLFTSFEQFYAEIGPKPTPSHSLDRWPNNDGPYGPGNIRWATPEQQIRNQRCDNCILLKQQIKSLEAQILELQHKAGTPLSL